MGKNMQSDDLQAAVEKVAVSRKAFLEKHPKFLKGNKPPASAEPVKSLEQMFGKEGAAVMRNEAAARDAADHRKLPDY